MENNLNHQGVEWERNLSEKEQAELKAGRIEDIESMIETLKDPEGHLGWMPLKGLLGKIKKFTPDYISWEEFGVTEENFRALFKDGAIKTIRLELEVWRKETDSQRILIGLIDAIREFVSEGICTYEELGTSEEELNKLSSLPYS